MALLWANSSQRVCACSWGWSGWGGLGVRFVIFCGSSAEGFAPLQPGVFSGLGSDLFLVGLGCSEVVFSELCLVSSVLF